MKGSKGFWVVIGITVLGAGAYYVFSNSHIAMAKTVVRLGGLRDYAWLLKADKGYVKAWAGALKKGQATFSYNNSKYNSAGGKATV